MLPSSIFINGTSNLKMCPLSFSSSLNGTIIPPNIKVGAIIPKVGTIIIPEKNVLM